MQSALATNVSSALNVTANQELPLLIAAETAAAVDPACVNALAPTISTVITRLAVAFPTAFASILASAASPNPVVDLSGVLQMDSTQRKATMTRVLDAAMSQAVNAAKCSETIRGAFVAPVPVCTAVLANSAALAGKDPALVAQFQALYAKEIAAETADALCVGENGITKLVKDLAGGILLPTLSDARVLLSSALLRLAKSPAVVAALKKLPGVDAQMLIDMVLVSEPTTTASTIDVTGALLMDTRVWSRNSLMRTPMSQPRWTLLLATCFMPCNWLVVWAWRPR